MKSKSRAIARAKKLAEKRHRMTRPGAKSKYARKHSRQIHGSFSPNSPFVAADHPDAAPRWGSDPHE